MVLMHTLITMLGNYMNVVKDNEIGARVKTIE